MHNAFILRKHLGEISYTERQPFAVIDQEDANGIVYAHSGSVESPSTPYDTNETVNRLVSHDFWEPVSTYLYDTVLVDLPEWMTAESYVMSIRRQISLREAIKCGATDDMLDHPRLGRYIIDGLWGMGDHVRAAFIKLMKTKAFRSTFRKGLFDQVTAWMADENSPYSSPLSFHQLESISRW